MEKDQVGTSWLEGERRGNIDLMIVLPMAMGRQAAEPAARLRQDPQRDERKRREGRKRNTPLAMRLISCLAKSGQ